MSLLVFDGSEMIRYNPSTVSIEASNSREIAELDAYIEEMNGKSNKTDEEIKELIKAMQQVNKYLRAIGAPESAMYDL